MKRFLPVGSVVLLKEGTKRVMIIGVKQVQEDGTQWDYSGCLYPEGIQNTDDLFIFNEDQIDMLFFIGFQDGEGLSFLEALNEAENDNADTPSYESAPDTPPYTAPSATSPPDIPPPAPPPPPAHPPPPTTPGPRQSVPSGQPTSARALIPDVIPGTSSVHAGHRSGAAQLHQVSAPSLVQNPA